MSLASYVITNFLGGEISQAAQGRMDLPAYKTSMNVCLNGIPIESGAWVRRPGTRHVAPSRGGKPAKIISFAFTDAFPYNMEFTDGFLRFVTGPSLVMTNDAQAVAAISTANAAVVQTAAAHGWSTGNSVAFNSLGVNNPLLQNRQFTITVVDTTHFSIADALTGASIDGSTLGSFVSGNVTRILEIATIYTSSQWQNLRSIQAEKQTVLVNGTQQPQLLQVVTDPLPNHSATFSLEGFTFLDGPFLDPIPGSLITPSGGLNGIITLTLSFSAYDATRAYNIGDFVTSAGLGYESLIPDNLNNTPVSSPGDWKPVNAGAAVGPNGFVSTDVGRQVRLYSEPPIWVSTTTYTAGEVVSFPDSVGASFPVVEAYTYWTAINGTTGVQPGTTADWALTPTAAQWTWGRITSVSGTGLVANDTAIGSLVLEGGIAAAFNGTLNQPWVSSAAQSASITAYFAYVYGQGYNTNDKVSFNGAAYNCRGFYTEWTPIANYVVGDTIEFSTFYWRALKANVNTIPQLGSPVWSFLGANNPINANVWDPLGSLLTDSFDFHVGQHYTSAATAVASATVFPTTDFGFADVPSNVQITLVLRASNSAPSSPSNGTELGFVTLLNQTSAVSITSNDTVSTWHYVWVEILATYQQPLVPNAGNGTFVTHMGIAQLLIYAPNVSNGSVITAQIAGLPLLYSNTIRVWRLGVYSDTTGWPSCGVYHEGRLWLSGAVGNRIDGSTTDSIFDFSPTSDYGVVSDDNGISYTFDAEDVNTIYWMQQDQQGIICGTQAGEWLVQATNVNNPLTPTNIQAHRVTKVGCANIPPRRAEHTLLFVQKFSRKLMEYFADVFSGKLSAPNLSERAKHLTVSGIIDLAYQQELAPIAWSCRTDGTLIGATYKRDTLMTSQGPNIIGWHRHALGSNRLVESLAVGPSVGGNLDTLSMVTNDGPTGIRHVEIMTDLLDEGFALTDCWFLDDAIIPSSTVVSYTPAVGAPYGTLTVNGLWQHNGKTVSAFIAGLDCGDYTVANGSITVPFGDGVSAGSGSGLFTAQLVQSFTTLPAVVGFTYNSDGQLVRPVAQADTGSPDGPGFAKLGRVRRTAALLYGCVNGSISFGTDFVTLDPAKLWDKGGNPYLVNQLWSGVWRDSTNSPIDFDNMVSWRISRPLPAFVLALSPFEGKEGA